MGIKKEQIGVAIGQEQISLDLSEQAAPIVISNRIRVYSKDVSGVSELFIRDDADHEVQITHGGTAGGASLADANTWTAKQTVPVLRLIPQSSEPSGQMGDFYVNTYKQLFLHNGITWNVWWTPPAPTPVQIVVPQSPTPSDLAVYGAYVYWIGGDTIYRQLIAGGSVVPVAVEVTGTIQGIAVDGTNVYWGTPTGVVRKVPVGGGSITDIATGLGSINYVREEGLYVYVNDAAAVISKIAKAGGSVATLTSATDPSALLEVHGGRVFWTINSVNPRYICSIPVDGGSIINHNLQYTVQFTAIAVDNTNVYWVESYGTSRLYYTPIIDAEYIYTIPGAIDLPNPAGLCVLANYLYWPDASEFTVHRIINIGGTIETIPWDTDYLPVAIIATSTNVFWINQTDGSIWMCTPTD